MIIKPANVLARCCELALVGGRPVQFCVVSYTSRLPWSPFRSHGCLSFHTKSRESSARSYSDKNPSRGFRSPFPRYAEDSSSFLLVFLDHVGGYRFLKQRGDFHWLTGIRIGRDRQGDVNMVTSS
ncbi:hypothetical protein NPIL_397281 [Nephila pilipes]|uniref:Uncharacterized protein n=1 Tax=Nephila pilipes TaxID=299642 RepID=A0A8X6PMX4_NEPPI|nr:hypothetical protein NPIL_397281 [Nephila pilipes]